MPLLPVLASQAGEAYRKGNYAECLDVLEKLQDEVSEDETKVLHNLTLAEFAKDNCKNPKHIMKRLSEILHTAGYKTKREKRSSRRLATTAEVREKGDADLTCLNKPGVALTLYNLAALLHQSRHTSATMSHLETIFENMDNIDELIVLRSCVLLLELYSMVLRCCTCLRMQRTLYMQRAVQVMDYCFSKKFFDARGHSGNGKSGSKSGGGQSNGGGSSPNAKESALSRQFRLRLNIAASKAYLAVEAWRLAKKPLFQACSLMEQPSSRNDLVGPAAVEDWNDRTSDFNFALQMLRANHEYLRKEYRKSVKLLHTFNATGPLQALFYNNMGCVHYRLNKYTSAAFYFTRALQVSVAQKQRAAAHESDKRTVPAHNQRTALGNHGEVSYNNGMALLAAHDYVSAFKCFQKAIFLFSSWPCLWFRMSECCTKAYNAQKGVAPLVKAAMGSRRLHRFLLSSAQLPEARGPPDAAAAAAAAAASDEDSGTGEGDGEGEGDGDGDSEVGSTDGAAKLSAKDARVMGFMTLEHAHQYLTNAMILIERFEVANDGQNSANGAGSPENKSKSAGTTGATGNPANGGSTGKPVPRILQHVLLNIAYVSLCLNNPVQAVLHTKRLLALPDLDAVTTCRARLYCAEAQCLLSRVSDAQRTLADAPTHGGIPTRERVATLVALANVHILQGQLDEAEAAVRRALKLSPGLPDGLRLMVYINLKRGKTSHVLKIIKTQELPSD
eukprot:INCI13112.1.p1 GENE.INCI13112.1~~INCI13112.1.p1  ORF type:complete len:730 (+),score=118.55 INCI13112.1:188-2377(+)